MDPIYTLIFSAALLALLIYTCPWARWSPICILDAKEYEPREPAISLRFLYGNPLALSDAVITCGTTEYFTSCGKAFCRKDTGTPVEFYSELGKDLRLLYSIEINLLIIKRQEEHRKAIDKSQEAMNDAGMVYPKI
jgi:hypothetical protein